MFGIIWDWHFFTVYGTLCYLAGAIVCFLRNTRWIIIISIMKLVYFGWFGKLI